MDYLGALCGVSRGGQLTCSVRSLPELRSCGQNPPFAVVGLRPSLSRGCYVEVALRFWSTPLGPTPCSLLGDCRLQAETLSEGGLACFCAATVPSSR